MNRSAPLRRGSGPKQDPEKTRAWQDRSRKPLDRTAHLVSRSTLDGFGPPKRQPPKRPDPIPAETRAAARARSGGRCIVCVFDGNAHNAQGKATALHHVFPKSRRKWPMLVAVEDNLVGVCFDCHGAHEGGSRRIPLLALPECVFRLAADVGPAAVDYLLGPTYSRERGA